MDENMTKKQLETSEIQTGACHYCGQIYQFETDGRAAEAHPGESSRKRIPWIRLSKKL